MLMSVRFPHSPINTFKGAGSFSIQKSMLQILDLYIGIFSDVFRKKLKHNFPKMRGWESKPLGIFSKIHPFW